MFYVYVLQSLKDMNWLYVGFSANLKQRLLEHNHCKVKSTKSRSSFQLVYYEAYRSENDARKREKLLKTHQQKDLLKVRIRNSLLMVT